MTVGWFEGTEWIWLADMLERRREASPTLHVHMEAGLCFQGERCTGLRPFFRNYSALHARTIGLFQARRPLSWLFSRNTDAIQGFLRNGGDDRDRTDDLCSAIAKKEALRLKGRAHPKA